MEQVLRGTASRIWKIRDSTKGFIVLWLLIVLFLGRAALKAYAEYSLPPRFYPAAFAISAAALLLKSLAMPAKWYYLLNAEGERLGFVKTAKIFYISQLSSYIPGGVWQYLEMGYRASKDGKDLEEVAHSVVFLHGVTVSSALFYALAAAAVVLPYTVAAVAGAVAVFALTLYAPELLEMMKGAVGGWVDVGEYRPSKLVLAKLFGISLLLWLVNGLFFFFLTASFVQVSIGLFLPVSAVLAVSWAAGFLVLVIPGGLGVRDASIVYLLSKLVPVPAALAVAAAARVMMLVGEVLMAALYIMAERRMTR